MRNKIYDLVADIEPIDQVESEHQEDTLQWIHSGVELCRFEKPATHSKHLESYCVLIYLEKRSIVLTAHQKALSTFTLLESPYAV